jgi:hypothetical protein
MDEPEILASDAEREQVATRLGAAVGDGRLTLAEYSERVGQAHAARTRGDLVPLTADLPATTGSQAPAVAPAPERTRWSVLPIGGEVKRGRWRVPARSLSVSLIGGASLDLSQAEFAAPTVEMTRWSIIGGMSVKVPPGVRVEVGGVSVLGGHSVTLPPPSPGAPTLRLRLFSLIGGVSVSST